MRRRVMSVVAGLLAAVTVLAGCGSGPGQVGAAVIVGPTAVPVDVVQAQLETALATPGFVAGLPSRGSGVPDVARDIVTRSITRVLFDEQARREGIVVTDQQVEARLTELGGAQAALQGAPVDEATLRGLIRDQLIAVALGERYVDRLSITVEGTVVESREEAEEVGRQLAAGRPVPTRQLDLTAAGSPQEAATAIFGTPAGQVVVFQPEPSQSAWFVLKIVDRRIGPPVDGPSAAASIGRDGLADIGRRLIQPLAGELGVRVNPRYGEWDPIQLRVVTPDALAGTIVPAPAP